MPLNIVLDKLEVGEPQASGNQEPRAASAEPPPNALKAILPPPRAILPRPASLPPESANLPNPPVGTSLPYLN